LKNIVGNHRYLHNNVACKHNVTMLHNSFLIMTYVLLN